MSLNVFKASRELRVALKFIGLGILTINTWYRKYTLKEIECYGSIEEETVNTKLGAIEGFVQEGGI